MNDKDLVEYFDMHSRTELALFNMGHIIRLFSLAGINFDLNQIPFCWPDAFRSVHYFDFKQVIEKARANVNRKLHQFDHLPHTNC